MKAKKFPLVYPTAGFAGMLFVLGAVWYAAASQNNVAVYLLFFVLIALLLVSIPHTLINLSGISVTVESVQPTFAGQELSLPIEIMNGSRATRHGLELVMAGVKKGRQRIDYLPADKGARVTLSLPAERRGEHEVGSVHLTSTYPLGFVRFLRRFSFSQRYLVYPKPQGETRLPSTFMFPHGSQPSSEPGEGEDFAGTRTYVPGESQRHIDWKAVARGQPLMSKQFTAEAEGIVNLDFSSLVSTNVEEKLSQLALWVIEAERAQRLYRLRLPAFEIPAGIGQSHFHHCLRALSMFHPTTSLPQRTET